MFIYYCLENGIRYHYSACIIADYLSSASSHWHLVVFSVLLMELIFRSTAHQARECQGGGYEGYFGSGPYLSTCLREFLWLPTVCHACTLEIQIWWSWRSSNTITKRDLWCLNLQHIMHVYKHHQWDCYHGNKHISVLTTELVSTASSAVLSSPFGDSCWYGKMRTLPPFAVRKFFPGCSQKLHPYAPLNWSMFWTRAFAAKSHVQHNYDMCSHHEKICYTRYINSDTYRYIRTIMYMTKNLNCNKSVIIWRTWQRSAFYLWQMGQSLLLCY